MRKYNVGDEVYYYIRNTKAIIINFDGYSPTVGYKYIIQYTSSRRKDTMYECLLFSKKDRLQHELDTYLRIEEK